MKKRDFRATDKVKELEGINDLKVHNEQKSSFLFSYLTEERSLATYRVNLTKSGQMRLKKLGHLTVPAHQNEDEEYIGGSSLCVCPKSRYLAVHLYTQDIENYASSINIYEIVNARMILKRIFSLRNEKIYQIYFMEFYGYFGDHLIINGISHDGAENRLLNYSYDMNRNELNLLPVFTKEIESEQCFKMIRFDNGNHFFNCDGDLCRFDFSI